MTRHCARQPRLWMLPLRTALSVLCCGLAIGSLCLSPICQSTAEAAKPNVVLVITDDQGYGDLGAHGNRVIQTPNLDRLHAQSVRLTDFHVDPTCSPTRSALMSGRYSTRTGVWHTIMGRSMMASKELTIAEVFAANGYRTAMFGKWHLGDNYPCRPHDQGFHEAFYNGGGGVTQTPDYFGNDYFDDTYFRRGVPEPTKGYCTDVWFDNALQFIEKEATAGRPFFTYLSTNAPHGPFLVADKYSQPYRDRGVVGLMAPFYGMITNIDENMGRLMAKLDQLKIGDNTILIFMTDNGTAAGYARSRPAKKRTPAQKKKQAAKQSNTWRGFNAGMRGTKGSEYDGGHRVPFFVRWPAAKLAGGRDVSALSAHVDVLPTLVAMCGLKKPDGPAVDGINLFGALQGEPQSVPADRVLLVHSQRLEHPVKWRKAAVMTKRWRLINGTELYDMRSDAGQQRNVAGQHQEVVTRLRGSYEKWWTSLSGGFDRYVRIHLGNAAENPAQLTCHDWHTNDKPVPWSQGAIRRGPMNNGFWAVQVEQAGTYEIVLRRWPKQLNQSLEATEATLQIGDIEKKTSVPADGTSATFTVQLPAGPAQLKTVLENPKGKRGAYFVDVKYLK